MKNSQEKRGDSAEIVKGTRWQNGFTVLFFADKVAWLWALGECWAAGTFTVWKHLRTSSTTSLIGTTILGCSAGAVHKGGASARHTSRAPGIHINAPAIHPNALAPNIPPSSAQAT